MLRRFGHLKRMDESTLTKAALSGNAVRRRHRRTFLGQIEQGLEKGQVRSTRNRRACLSNLMKVEESKGSERCA
jgi:hypothetical protein